MIFDLSLIHLSNCNDQIEKIVTEYYLQKCIIQHKGKDIFFDSNCSIDFESKKVIYFTKCKVNNHD